MVRETTAEIEAFHCRRIETWEAKGIPAVERFRYLYDADELGEWVREIAALLADGAEATG